MVGFVNNVAIMLWTLEVANTELRDTVKLWAYVYAPVRLTKEGKEFLGYKNFCKLDLIK